MNRRWFQFSLRTAIVTTLLAAVALGIYIRYPYYRSAKALDEAEGDKSSPGWALVRESLINDQEFRETVDSQIPLTVSSTEQPAKVFFVYGMSKVWRIKISVENGQWKVNELVGMPYLN